MGKLENDEIIKNKKNKTEEVFMYIVSFLKNLFRPRKIWCSLYFLANLAIVFCVFGFILSGGNDVDAGMFVANGFIGIAINTVITLISLSPIGEAYVRMKEKVKKVERNADTEAIYAIFDEVYAAAKAKNPKLGDKVKLYYKPTDEVNAYALGHRTVIITGGLLKSMDADMIKGVLAHEFGHISSGDSDLKLGISVSNSILMIFMVLVSIVIGFFSAIVSIASETSSGKALGRMIGVIGIFLVTAVYGLWAKIGMLLVNATSRKDEYAADAFAVDCGFGADLYDALDALDGVKTKSDFLSLLSSTHPDTVDRLAAIKKRLEEMNSESLTKAE